MRRCSSSMLSHFTSEALTGEEWRVTQWKDGVGGGSLWLHELANYTNYTSFTLGWHRALRYMRVYTMRHRLQPRFLLQCPITFEGAKLLATSTNGTSPVSISHSCLKLFLYVPTQCERGVVVLCGLSLFVSLFHCTQVYGPVPLSFFSVVWFSFPTSPFWEECHIPDPPTGSPQGACSSASGQADCHTSWAWEESLLLVPGRTCLCI